MRYKQLTDLSGGSFFALDEHHNVVHIFIRQPDLSCFEEGYDYEFEGCDATLVYTKTRKEKPSFRSARRVHGDNGTYYLIEEGFDSRKGVITSPMVKDIVVVRNLPSSTKEAIIIVDICNQTHDLYYVNGGMLCSQLVSKESLEDYSAAGIIAFVSGLNDQLYRLQGNDSGVETLQVSVTFNYTGQPDIKFCGLTLFDMMWGVTIEEFGYDQIKANLNKITALIGKFKCA